MAKYQPKITIESDNVQNVQTLANLIQSTVNAIEHDELITLLSKVQKNPSIVKTALKYI